MSDPQEAATPSDPHSAELIATLRREAALWDAEGPTPQKFLTAAEALEARDAEVAELRAERDGLLLLREVAHWECDCVPDLGPTHCHACSDAAGHPVEWADSTHGPSAEVAELKAKIADAWDEGREAEQKFRELKLYRRATNPYRSASSPAAEVSGNPQ